VHEHKLVKEGSWLYDGRILSGVRVVETDCALGTGDYKDDPEIAADRPGTWFWFAALIRSLVDVG
jgi:hypothetical protein